MNTSNFTSVCLQGVGVMLGFAEENSCSGAASTVPGNVSCAYPEVPSVTSVCKAGRFGKYMGTGCQIWGQNLLPVLTKTYSMSSSLFQFSEQLLTW